MKLDPIAAGTGAADTPAAATSAADRRGVRLLLGIVFGFLGISVTVHAVALTYVFSTQTDLVRADYYQAGQTYDHEMSLRAAAAREAFDVRVAAGPAGSVTVRLPQASAALSAASGRLKLYRPGSARLDRTLPLPAAVVTDGTAVWRVPANDLAVGRWRVRFELDAATPLALEVDRDVR